MNIGPLEDFPDHCSQAREEEQEEAIISMA